jgi:hypothetical protein
MLKPHQNEEQNMVTRKVGRNAEDGKFIPVKEAERDKKGAVVERIKYPNPAPPPKKGK